MLTSSEISVSTSFKRNNMNLNILFFFILKQWQNIKVLCFKLALMGTKYLAHHCKNLWCFLDNILLILNSKIFQFLFPNNKR
jgi:hypothetical protein